ncbi:MAG: hypothetical protein ACLFO2_03555 [Candidatus Woesearchaeota archaeon]
MANQNKSGGQQAAPDKTLAILSLVFAIIVPLVGLILALIARNKYPKGVDGHELVNIALIVSIILLVIPLLLIIAGAGLFFM